MTKIEILGAKAPAWGDSKKTIVNLQVNFSHLDGFIPFSASPTDPVPHGQALFASAVAGEFGEIAPYSGPSDAELTAQVFEASRSQLMATTETRITQLERVKRLGMETPAELEELEGLEVYSVHLMRAKGPKLPKSPIVR